MYYAMIKILTIIKKYLTGWEPHDIFYSEYFVQYNNGNPFAIPDTSFYIKYDYTKLGNWFENAPDIISLLKLFWYIPACIVHIIVNIVWSVIELFLPKKIKDKL